MSTVQVLLCFILLVLELEFGLFFLGSSIKTCHVVRLSCIVGLSLVLFSLSVTIVGVHYVCFVLYWVARIGFFIMCEFSLVAFLVCLGSIFVSASDFGSAVGFCVFATRVCCVRMICYGFC